MPSPNGDSRGTALGLAALVLAAIVLLVWWERPGRGREGFDVDPSGMVFGGEANVKGPERHSVHAALSRLYSTADVEPLITGALYEHADHIRPVYAQRTSHGDVHGLTEYSSGGGPGDVGVDVGPFGLDEYGGRQVGFDDGIPPTWALPSTPIRWYRPHQRDYYGPEGPTAYTEGLYTLTEPDHDQQVS
jgi:hypothetical protein